MRVIYINSQGTAFELEGKNIRVKSGNFHSFNWNVDVEALNIGARVKGFKKDPVAYEITLNLRGDLEERKKLLDSIHDAAEYDIHALTPGTVYFGDYYIKCFALASDTHADTEISCRTDKTISIYCPYPFWIKEESYYLPPVNIEEKVEINTVPATLPNTHFTDCHFRLRAYGPFLNDAVGNMLFFYINDCQYQVDFKCKENEYIELDTRDETITLVDALTGSRTNIYHLQNFNLDNFKKIPAGDNILRYSRTYALEFTLFHERSEPKWNETQPDTYFALMTEDGHPIITEDGYYIVGPKEKGGTS